MPDQEGLGARILEVLNLYQTRKSAADVAGISVDQLLAYTKGSSSPPFVVLARLAGGVGVTLDWLASGSGAKFAGSGGAFTGADSLAVVARFEPGTGGVRAVEGGPDGIGFESEWVHTVIGTDPKHLVLATVQGDSMDPTLRDGDVLLVDTTQRDPAREGVYLIRHQHVVTVKRLQHALDGSVCISSDNPVYQTHYVRGKDVEALKVIGRVVWAGGRM